MWSDKEFDKQIGAYWVAANARGDRLLKVFFVLFGVALGTVVLMVTCILSRSVGIAVELAVLGGFILLAIYILATAGAFHRAHCVVCVHCGSSLLSLGEELEGLAESGVEMPQTLACPICHEVVVKKGA